MKTDKKLVFTLLQFTSLQTMPQFIFYIPVGVGVVWLVAWAGSELVLGSPSAWEILQMYAQNSFNDNLCMQFWNSVFVCRIWPNLLQIIIKISFTLDIIKICPLCSKKCLQLIWFVHRVISVLFLSSLNIIQQNKIILFELYLKAEFKCLS